jgi:uncharacterized delta-60 repeat protein
MPNLLKAFLKISINKAIKKFSQPLKDFTYLFLSFLILLSSAWVGILPVEVVKANGTAPTTSNISGISNIGLPVLVNAAVNNPTGGTLTYKWYSDTTCTTQISGATSSSYTFEAQNSATTITYSYTVTNSSNQTSVCDSTQGQATATWIDLSAGNRDYSFASGNTINSENDNVYAIAVQVDGKVIIGGSFITYNGTARGCLARLNSDGSLDTTFLNTEAGANGIVYAIAIQSDGKVLIGGQFTSVNGTTRNRIARLNSDGSLDATFSSTADNSIYSIAIQSDGKVIIGGQFTSVNGTTRNRVARLNSNGSHDTTFLNTGEGVAGAISIVYAIAIQSDGKVIIGGYFTTYNGTSRGSIARLNSNGSLDTTFFTGTGANGYVYAIAMQSDGKVIIGGSFSSYNGTARGRVARLLSSGSQDTTFLNTGEGANSDVYAIAIQSDGKVIIGGDFTTYNGIARGRIARINSNGSLDTTFLNTGDGASITIRAIAMQSDGKVIIGGQFSTYNGTSRGRIARLNSDGSLDTTFLNTGVGANSTVYAIAMQSDGKVIIGGGFTIYNGIARGRIARLNSDGSLDTTFLNTGVGANGIVRAIAIQSDGKIVIGGQFTAYNGTSRGYVARLNSDGSLDTTFLNTGAGANNNVHAIAMQSDGKVIIGGQFTTYNGTTRRYVARLDIDGSVDTTFLNTGTGANNYIYAVAIQSDGKVIIGGIFTTYNGTSRGRIARLNSDGSLDTIFLNTGVGASSTVFAIAIQSDGKVIIGGQFTTYNGTSRGRIARLNSDGSLDTTFLNTGAGAGSIVYSIAIQSDGKVIIGGGFTTYNGIARGYLARINSDGSLDTTFLNTGAGAAGASGAAVYAIAMHSDGKIVIGGGFTTYNSLFTPYLARVNAFTPSIPIISADNNSDTWYNGTNKPTVSVTATDEVGLAEVRFKWGTDFSDTNCNSDSGGSSISLESLPYALTGEDSAPAGGTTLYLCARNTSGNKATWNGVYNWENTPPSMPNAVNTDDENNGEITGAFVVNIPSGSTDTGGSGLASYSLWKCDDNLLTQNCVVIQSGVLGSTVSVSGEFLPTEDSTFYYYWTSVDNVGNTSDKSEAKALTMNAIIPPTLTNTPTPTVLLTLTPVPGGTTVQGVAPEIKPVLITDWNTNLETTAQTGNVVVGVEDTVNANIKVAEMTVNFGSAPNWTGVTGATAENIAFFHSPQPISVITNGAATSYTLYIRKGEGDKVWICPGAAALNEVNLQCSGGYFLSEGQTLNGATASVVMNTVEYWKVSGLTSTGGMSVITGLKDVLSRLQVSTLSDHKLSFGTSYGMIVGSTDTMTLEFPDFDLTGLTVTDIALTDNVGSLRTLAGTASADTWGVAINTVAKSIIFSVPTSGTGGFVPASQIIVKIGLNVVGGVNQIMNPSSIGNTTISITLNNTDPGEMGILNIPIIDSDTVDISGYVTAFIHFDIDTNTDNTDCAYNVCTTHGTLGAGIGNNYTVDFGELTSAIVNKSMTSSKHADGLNGLINSIYFDLTTNAPSGAVVTVKSLNSGLKGPGTTNLIASVSDGLDIAANSGLYGYNLTTGSTQKYGAIYPNSLCDTIIKFCGPTSTPKTVFDTNNLPVDSARVRMDLAAAAAYTNNPGTYTDTLTFVATATF